MNRHGAGPLRCRMRGDGGASLVMVMVFVMGIGLVLTALLSYAQTAIVSKETTQSRHLLSSDASGALDAAITQVRWAPWANPGAAPDCPAHDMVVPGVEAQIRIVCQEHGGLHGGVPVPISALNKPASALLTLGTATSETGLAKASNAPLRIKGRVYVNSNITVSGSTCASSTDPNCSRIEVMGNSQLIAKTGCPLDKVTSNPAPDCSSTGNPPEGKDPATLTDADIPPDASTGHPGGSALATGYVQPPSGFAELPLQIVPASCPAGNVVELNPGYYDDARTLTNLTSSCNKPIHFKPGVYYFDFRNAEVANMPVGNRPFAPGGQGNVWTINNNSANAYVIGGTRKDWNATGPTVFPGACVSPLNAISANQGVQFVFGGSSRLDIAKGQVELCGQYAADKPPLVIYGAKSDTTPAPQATGDLTTTTTTTPVAPSDVAFVTPDLARAQDGGAATAAIARSATAVTTASLRLTGSDLAGRIPPGSILTSARLRLVHKEATTTAGDAVSVTVLPNPLRSGPAPAASTPTVSLNTTPTLRTDTFDLTAALATEVWRYGLGDLRIDYLVSAAKVSGSVTALTAELDAAQLVLEWQAPSLRGQTTPIAGSNCVGAVGGCALVTTGGNGSFLYLQGTTYAPRAWFDIRLTNVTGQVFRSGIISRALSMQITPSTTFTGPVIEVPDENVNGVSVELYLTAYACPASGSCLTAPVTGMRRIGRAAVDVVVPMPPGGWSGAPSSDGKRTVTVKSWNVLE